MVPQGHWHYFCLLPPLHFAATIIFDKLIFCVNRRALVESCNFQDVFILYLNFAALFELPRILKYLVSDSFSFALSLSFNFKIAPLPVIEFEIFKFACLFGQLCYLPLIEDLRWIFCALQQRPIILSWNCLIFSRGAFYFQEIPRHCVTNFCGGTTKSSQARFNCPSCNWRLNWRECVSNM